MKALEVNQVGESAVALKAWKQGWTNAHLAKTVFGSWDWNAAAKQIKEDLPPE